MQTEVTSKDKTEAITWKEYPVTGLLVAMMLVILDYSDRVYYLTIPVFIFFLVTGIKENTKALISFIKKYFPVLIILAVSSGYYHFIAKAAGSGAVLGTIPVLIFAGSCLALRDEDDSQSIYDKLWVFMLALVILGIVKNVFDKAVGYFMTAEAELTAVIIFAAITILFMGEIKLKAAGIAVSAISGILQIKNGAVGIHKTAGQIIEFVIKSPANDYGFIIMILSIILCISAIYIFVKSEDKLMKRHAILVCIAVAAGIANAALNQLNIMFILYTIIGIYMGQVINNKTI